MKMIKIFVISAFLSAGFSMPVFAAVAVIVHPDNPNTLDAKQVRKLFLGKLRAFPNGMEVLPIDQAVDDPSRAVFVKKILKKGEGNLNSYWARMIFSSKGKPPKVINNPAEMKKLIAANKNAIGYIDAAEVDDTVKVVVTVDVEDVE